MKIVRTKNFYTHLKYLEAKLHEINDKCPVTGSLATLCITQK